MIFSNKNAFLVFAEDNEIGVIPVNAVTVRQIYNGPMSFEVESNGRIRQYERNKNIKITEQEVAALFKNANEELVLKG